MILTARPTSQSSIQSSTSSSNIKVLGSDHGDFMFDPLTEDGIGNDTENLQGQLTSLRLATSPLAQEVKVTTHLELSADSNGGFLSGISSAMVTLLLIQATPGSKDSPPMTEYPLSEFTRSSQLSLHPVDFMNMSALSKRAYSRRKVIEEVMETEESFISSIKILSGIYLSILIDMGNNGIPMRLALDYVDILIVAHEEFLQELRELYTIALKQRTLPFDSSDLDETSKEMFSCSSPLMAELVAKLINKKLIPVYIYQEFSSLLDLVLKLTESQAIEPGMGNTLTRNFQNFLEVSQHEDDRMDLSFASLISKPLTRLGKYKLFLQSLAKATPPIDDEECSREIISCAAQIGYSIMEVNRYGVQERNKRDTLFAGLCFPHRFLKFPVEYLGLPLLNGAFYAVWIGKDCKLQSQLFGAFLFKTHIILASVVRANRFEVQFLVPLAVSKCTDCMNSNGGMHSNYESSFKLMFENEYKVYELLLICCDSNENTIWREKLDILTSVVNGPYKFDYSSSKCNEEQGTLLSALVPFNVQCVDAQLEKAKFGSTIRRRIQPGCVFDKCYFRQVIAIRVEASEDGTHGSFRFRSGDLDAQLVVVRELDRCRIESMLQELWSDELTSLLVTARRKKMSTKWGFVSRTTANSRADSTGSVQSIIATKRVSLMRKTSIVFGDALKSILNR